MLKGFQRNHTDILRNSEGTLVRLHSGMMKESRNIEGASGTKMKIMEFQALKRHRACRWMGLRISGFLSENG